MRTGYVLAALLIVMPASTASATEAGDRRGRFNELARRYAEATDPQASEDLLSELFAVVDAEVVDNLRSGGPFASAAFIQQRLEAFSEDWGGVTFLGVQPERGGPDATTLLAITVTRAEPRGSLRIYGRAGGAVSLLTATLRDGALALHAWPRGREGATQFLVSWEGAPTGRGSRLLHLELWQLDARAGARSVWSSGGLFPEGLWAIAFDVARGQFSVRHEARYPGWTSGCAGQTEEEDAYRQPPAGEAPVLMRRRVWNGWHRELHAAVARLLAALGTDDARALAELVPNGAVRARLPRALELEPACDERVPAPAGTVIVAAATRGGEPALIPWSLTWRRGPRGWRLAAAHPVLK
jgi:hypothetical protein